MKQIDLSKYEVSKPKSKITNERQLVIKDFLDRLNLETRPPYKPLTPARVGMLLRHASTSQLKAFYASCNDSKSFSKFFWWSVNPKKH